MDKIFFLRLYYTIEAFCHIFFLKFYVCALFFSLEIRTYYIFKKIFYIKKNISNFFIEPSFESAVKFTNKIKQNIKLTNNLFLNVKKSNIFILKSEKIKKLQVPIIKQLFKEDFQLDIKHDDAMLLSQFSNITTVCYFLLANSGLKRKRKFLQSDIEKIHFVFPIFIKSLALYFDSFQDYNSCNLFNEKNIFPKEIEKKKSDSMINEIKKYRLSHKHIIKLELYRIKLKNYQIITSSIINNKKLYTKNNFEIKYSKLCKIIEENQEDL